jgi:hypothetical protein
VAFYGNAQRALASYFCCLRARGSEARPHRQATEAGEAADSTNTGRRAPRKVSAFIQTAGRDRTTGSGPNTFTEGKRRPGRRAAGRARHGGGGMPGLALRSFGKPPSGVSQLDLTVYDHRHSPCTANLNKWTSGEGIPLTPCFEDWKRFCFVLREIAGAGGDGRPLPGFEAQRRAQAILTERGYAWRSVTANGNNKRITRGSPRVR